MWAQIDNWLYQNAMAVFISVIVPLLIWKGVLRKFSEKSVNWQSYSKFRLIMLMLGDIYEEEKRK